MKTHLAVLVVTVAASFSAMAVSTSDIQSAKVITVTTKTTAGYLNVANGRNCLAEKTLGEPALLACDDTTPVTPEEESSTLHYIVLNSGQCLSDEGSTLGVATCDYQNTKQQWKAFQDIQTEVRNIASNKCLTTAGLNKPVKMLACSGLPAQNWKLPQ
ncbi:MULTISPECIES: ricin-type beta-trefoil lectin domain protein [unclassified Serratia (in: enterobacteria)]|uniref:ricin-type beta-trefoil lectin domain protein n=1 Tax=unclassified Serratia (in: enterobacteria) TaxID=2647522 RepID=UPI00307650C3